MPDKREIYVIRGKNGMKFESCTIGHEGQEETYDSLKTAEIAKQQIERSIPFEQFEIIKVEK